MKITNTEVYGLDFALRSSGFPMRTEFEADEEELKAFNRGRKLGNAKSGSGHDCYLKGIVVNFELEYDMFWIPQLHRYHFIDFISSSSNIHKGKLGIKTNKYVDSRIMDITQEYIDKYNANPCPETLEAMLSNFPQGQVKHAGLTTNYLQLKSMYNQRKSHKLDIWKKFCAWCESLPHFAELCLNGERMFTFNSNLPIEERYDWNDILIVKRSDSNEPN